MYLRYKPIWAGLVVKAEDLCLRDHSLQEQLMSERLWVQTLQKEAIFSLNILFDQKCGAKRETGMF